MKIIAWITKVHRNKTPQMLKRKVYEKAIGTPIVRRTFDAIVADILPYFFN